MTLFRHIATAAFTLPTLLGAMLAHADPSLDPFIHHETAVARAEQVSEISYALDFDITGTDAMSATAEVSFTYKPADRLAEPLILDFQAKQVASIEVNGIGLPVDGLYQAVNEKIVLSPEHLAVGGRNTVRVIYQVAHKETPSGLGTGKGLYRSTDAEHGETFIFTKGEPVGAHLYFPCFDQPDLRALFSLNLTLPADWTAVSAEQPEATRASGDVKTVSFAQTRDPIGVHLFSFAAGPFQSAEADYGDMKLRLFYPSSALPNLDPARVLKTTASGMAFFEETFGIAYPFAKYDQVILYGESGGMEHVGATHLGSQLFTEKESYGVSEETWLHYSNGIILHELAHSWFGNLVTIQWWDDLWLKESFAEYFEYLAALRVDDPAVVEKVFAEAVGNARRFDDGDAAAAVKRPLASTEGASQLFDGITYAKGAAVLRIFHEMLGDGFFAGVREFLKANRYAAADAEDFLAAVKRATGRDFSGVFNPWITTPGQDEISVRFSCAGDRIESFSVLKRPLKGSPDRLQLVDLALYAQQALDSPAGRKTVFVSSAATEIPELAGEPCPAFVYGDADGRGYFKYRFDGTSAATGASSFNELQNAVLRKGFFDFARNEAYEPVPQGISTKDLLNLTLNAMPLEQENDLFIDIVNQAEYLLATLGDLSWEVSIPGLTHMQGRYSQLIGSLTAKYQDNPQRLLGLLPVFLGQRTRAEILEYQTSGKIGALDFNAALAANPWLYVAPVLNGGYSEIEALTADMEWAEKKVEGTFYSSFVGPIAQHLRMYGPADLALKKEAIDAAVAFDPATASDPQELHFIFYSLLATKDLQNRLQPAVFEYGMSRFLEFQAKHPGDASSYLWALLPNGCSPASRQSFQDALAIGGLDPAATRSLTDGLAEQERCLVKEASLIRDFKL